MITIRFIKPGKDQKTQGSSIAAHMSTDYLSVSIDKRKTVSDLKALIAQEIGMSQDQFRLCNNPLAKKEFKDPQQKLAEVGVYDGTTVFLQEGKPLNPEEYFVHLSYYEFDPLASTKEERSGKPTFVDLSGIVVHENSLVSDVQKIAEELYQQSPIFSKEKVSSHYVARLRERLVGNRAGRILLPHLPLKSSISLRDGVELALEHVSTEEAEFPSDKDHLAIVIQRFFPSQWCLGHRIQLFLDSRLCVGEFKCIVSGRFDIPLEYLRVAKPIGGAINTKDLFPIATLDWTIANRPNADVVPITSSGMWQTREGDIFFVKDNREIDQVDTSEYYKQQALLQQEQGLHIYTIRN
jgi:hypothetical protein